MRKAPLMAISVIGLAIAATASLEAQEKAGAVIRQTPPPIQQTSPPTPEESAKQNQNALEEMAKQKQVVASVPLMQLEGGAPTTDADKLLDYLRGLTGSKKGPGYEASLMTVYAEEKSAAMNYLDYFSPRVIGYVFDRSLPGLVALHRYRHRDNDDYFYTTDEAEGSRAVSNFNYISEGICCYLSNTQRPGTTPLFRLLNKEKGFHFYTGDVSVRDWLRYERGFVLEGTEGYLWTRVTYTNAP